MKIVSRPEDEAAVCAFERLLHSQPPPGKRWTPVTDYSFETRRVVEGRRPELLQWTFGHGPMLDYGCGPDAILVRLLRERNVEAYGLDPILRREWRPTIMPRMDAAYPHPLTIIVREVFEHLTIRDIKATIGKLLRFNPTYIYVTTRFADDSKNPPPDHLLTVQTSDDLDPDHRTMLTRPFLRLLFVLEGCTSRPDLEAKMDWEGLNNCLVMEVPR